MSLSFQIRRLRIETKTADGLYGVDIPFDAGLNVIHADNTLGKSSCFQAILYGLGLEGTLGPSRKLPLKSVLTTKLRKPDGSEVRVIGSDIYLELRNSQDRYITVRRSSSNSKKDLITVWEECRLDMKLQDQSFNDYYVRMEGAYARERGFHHYLSQFLDLKLPEVLKYDGGYCPLYLETVFSVFYVEQTRGWGGIQNVLPTYLGIQHVAERVIEFVLALDVQSLRKKRENAEAKRRNIGNRWSTNIARLEELADSVSGRVADLPKTPTADIDYEKLCDVAVLQESKEITIKEALQNARSDLVELRDHKIPTVDESADSMTKELEEKIDQLGELDKITSRLIEDLETTANYVESIMVRKDGLGETLRKYKDVRRLVGIGSEEEFKFVQRICPTCGQHIDDSLLPHVHDHEVLGVEDNIGYLEKQVKILNTLLLSEENRRKEKERLLSKARQDLHEARASIRAIKDSLVSTSNTPSKESVRREVVLEARIEHLAAVNEKILEVRDGLKELAADWEVVRLLFSALPYDDLSPKDHIKLTKLEEIFRNLLGKFDYRSTRISDLRISSRTYKPTIENVELGAEASASDNIRMIWAYLYSLMTVARSTEFSTNHLGILLLDEPRQQEARDISFKEFLRVSASALEFDQQVIIGTSENYGELQAATEGLPINVRHFDSEIIAPMKQLRS